MKKVKILKDENDFYYAKVKTFFFWTSFKVRYLITPPVGRLYYENRILRKRNMKDITNHLEDRYGKEYFQIVNNVNEQYNN